ncbi:MAG: ribonuclease P protein component [Anaerolineales bacterium]
MVKRRFRLTRSTDFKRVRSNGKSYAHPLLVLVVSPAQEDSHVRFGVTASRGIGGAVIRNRAKRLMREALRPLLPDIRPGWDVVAIARAGLLSAEFRQIQSVVRSLLQRAGLL